MSLKTETETTTGAKMAIEIKTRVVIAVASSKATILIYTALSVVILINATSAMASNDYKLKIQTSFEISESCATASGSQTSQIELVIDSSASSTNVRTLTNAAARVKVCSPFLDPISQTLPIPLPVALMNQRANVAIGTETRFSLQNAGLSAMFKTDTPDVLIVTKTQSNVFELRYINSKTNDIRIGPIRATLSASVMREVPGYIPNSLPISYIEVDVQEQNVTLKANILSMKATAGQNIR